MTLGNEPYFSNGFKDLIVWQKAKDLTKGIYAKFKDCRDYGFRDQIQRASVSIMNNVAEGFDRNNKKELRHFLQNSERIIRRGWINVGTRG